MGREIKANYEQTILLPRNIEDWLPADHPARFIREFIDSQDLRGLGFKASETAVGRPLYSSELLAKVWIYGFYSQIKSSRKLEKACRENIALIWLTGLNYPDHNTLWRFFRDNRGVLEKLTRGSVRVAIHAGLVGLVLHAIDGTKIPARSSKDKVLHRKELERLLAEADAEINSLYKHVENGEREGREEFRMPPELEDVQKRRKKIEEGLKELDEANKNHMNPCEPEVNMVKTHREGLTLGYNAQAVADAKSGLIVAHDVVTDENDAKQLVPMLDKVKETLGTVAEENVADSGYNSLKEISKAEEQGYEILTPVGNKEDTSGDKGEFDFSKFRYEKEKDLYICPLGKELIFEREEKRTDSEYSRRIYRCKSHKECPYRNECSKDKKGRTIKVSEYHYVVEEQREKQKDPEKKKLMGMRKQIIEPVFARIKEVFGFRRFTVAGLRNAKGQWSLACLVYNLSVLYKYWLRGELLFEAS
jgi:transposase